jgi:hypothetical protein
MAAEPLSGRARPDSDGVGAGQAGGAAQWS